MEAVVAALLTQFEDGRLTRRQLIQRLAAAAAAVAAPAGVAAQTAGFRTVNLDHLRGLKENVTMGRLIPAGTGFEWYRHVRIPADEPPPPPTPPQPSEDDLDLDREIEYAFDTDEPMLGRPPAGDVE